jgi:tetratricopeptide (TPR) repeat protein
MKRLNDGVRADRRTWGLILLAVVLPASAAALMPRGGVAVGPDTSALQSEAPLPDYCLAPNAEELLAKCPPGVDPNAMQGVNVGRAPEAAAEDQVLEQRGAAAGVGQGSRRPGIAERPDDPRRINQERRIEDLIQREISLTERLIRTTPDSDTSKPDIYYRLAQLFYEMQDNRNFAAGERDMQCLDLESRGETNSAQECYQERDRLRGQANEWSDKAIEAYYNIVTSFPDWERIDEALFYLAFAFEERARTTENEEEKSNFNFKARSVYNVLIRDHQGSPYVPNAYLSFAEYYFNEEGDMYKALEYYNKILGIEGCRVYGYAMYKKAWCLYNLQEYQQSLSTFEDVIAYAQQHTENADSPELLRTARLELPLVYAQSGRADQAWRYFTRVGGDLVVRMMQSLAEYYYSQGEHDNAIIAYHTLMDEDRESDSLCNYQYWVTQSRMAQATTVGGVASQDAKQAVVEEIRNTIEVWKIFVVRDGSRHNAEKVRECTWWSADFAIDIAVRWHREATGTDQQPGTNDTNTMDKASQLYTLFLENFGTPGSPYFYDQLQPPPDWEYQNPYSIYKARYFQAELLWKMEKWEECGAAFDEVVRLNPAGEYASEAAYASVLCYKKQYDQEMSARDQVLARDTGRRGQEARERERERQREGEGETWGTTIGAPREFTDREINMENAFHRYICYVDQHEDLANVKFSRAFLFLDANRWNEAAVLFKAIAEEFKGTQDGDDRRIAILAAMNYFEIIVRLRRAGVEECTVEVIAAAQSALDTQFPSGSDGPYLENDEERNSLNLYLEAIPVLHCQQMLFKVKELADARQWEPAAETALRVHDEFPTQYPGYRCLDENQQDMMDRILNEACNYLENANKIMRAVQCRDRLVQQHPDSTYVRDAQFKVAQAYARLAFFERAAEAYETFARNYATGSRADERAPEAMLNAVQIRIGLGQDQLAKTDADFLDQKFGSNRKYQKKAAEAYFLIGEMYQAARDWQGVIDHYAEYLSKYGRKGGKEFEVRATMLVALGYWELGKCPADASGAVLNRCRDNKNKAYENATRANGLIDLPEYRDEAPAEGAAPPAPEEIAAQIAARREETWNTLVEKLDLEVEADTEEIRLAQIFVRTEKVALALGQARFYIGEKLYEQFLAIRWPDFDPDDWNPGRSVIEQCQATLGLDRAGCTSMEKYNAWNREKFTPFTQDRHEKIGDAKAYYDSIAYLSVPTWEIAAASRVGDMYFQFWQDLYRAPIPPVFERTEFMEVAEAYRAALDEGAEPLKQNAVEAFRYCLATATREQWFNEYSDRCEQALYEIDPTRYRVSNEAYARPSLNRIHYAPPDLDLGIITTTTAFGERQIPVDVVPGAPSVDDHGRYEFNVAPAAPPPAPEPAPEEAAEEEESGGRRSRGGR